MKKEENVPFNNIEATELGHTFPECKKYYVWLDVRTAKEYAQAHIADALHIPHDELENRLAELTPYRNAKIALVCQRGGRSTFAAELLTSHGFTSLYNVTGGMEEWTGPVVQGAACKD